MHVNYIMYVKSVFTQLSYLCLVDVMLSLKKAKNLKSISMLYFMNDSWILNPYGCLCI